MKSAKYQLIISAPKNIYIKADKDMKGPKGISSFLPLIFNNIKITDITAPITKENNDINNTPFMPNINPNAAISFMSPPPMAFVKSAIAKNNTSPVKAPAMLLKKALLIII